MGRFKDTMQKGMGRFDINNQSELWIKDKYDEIINEETAGYSLLSLTLKKFDEYQYNVGHVNREEAIEYAYELLSNCLQDGEYIARIHSWYFNILVKCDANEESLHKRAYPFHFAIRDGMEKKYGYKLYLEMGFYPIYDFDVYFYVAQHYADKTRYGLQNLYVETNYDMYNISYTDQKESFRKIESLIKPALDNGHFQLYLQPKVDLKTKEIYSAEALMRWIDPEKGMIPLSQFLPNIEENGFIRDVDLYLFEQGCKYIEKWKKQFGKDIQISFNLSGAYFNGQYFYPNYKEVFDKYDIPSKSICIELLESIVLNDLEQLKQITNNLDQLKFECALDDFGSGFSSFDILTSIPLKELKIDRSLFRNFDNKKEQQLLKHIVDIAHEFGMRAVAEGIETKEYVEYMQSIGCDYIQGFYYYKPMPVEEFEEKFVRLERSYDERKSNIQKEIK